MRLDPNPVFRKTIVPWYDSETVCYIMIFIMIIVFFFGIVGISVAFDELDYNASVGLPVSLAVLSLLVIILNVRNVIVLYIKQERPFQE
jgi:hypothetical protein